MIAVCGGYLVESIDHVVDHSPLSKTTVGLIILPLVGNAAELISGIMFASRKQIDLAFAVAIGSAIQIALFVTPLMVILGWGLEREMSLRFTPFESVCFIGSTALFSSLVINAKCSTVKGLALLIGYIIIG
jgi:Ca2+:H+ antiporter